MHRAGRTGVGSLWLADLADVVGVEREKEDWEFAAAELLAEIRTWARGQGKKAARQAEVEMARPGRETRKVRQVVVEVRVLVSMLGSVRALVLVGATERKGIGQGGFE